MRHIRGGRWFDIGATGTGGFVIHESACLRSLVENMPNPASQQPRLWIFLGSIQKNRCLHAIFAENAFTRADSGTIRLRGDVASLQTDRPIFFADGDPWNSSAISVSSPAKGGHNYHLDWNADTVKDVIHSLYSAVLFPFADIVCLFVEDLPPVASVAGFLAKHGSVPGFSHRARPRLIVVTESTEESAAWSSIFKSDRLSEVFSAVSIVSLTVADLVPNREYGRFKTLLEGHSQEVQQLRRDYMGPLSGLQFKVFLQSAVTQLGKTREYAFDCIRSSRTPNDLPESTGRNIQEAYQRCLDAGLSSLDGARFVASALIMDHYRPEMPLMDPRLVFQTLYRPRILDAISSGTAAPIDMMDLVETEMVREFIQLRQRAVPSRDLRKEIVNTQSRQYSPITSNRVCLYCLIQPAQHFTPCDHPMCDLCAQRFGIPTVGTEYQFSVDQCLLCNATVSMIIDTLPPTMDPSVLAIDGGGVRGVIPLEFLILIQEYLGSCRLQEVVDLNIDTSSGGLSSLGIRTLDWSITVCAEMFGVLAQCIFEGRRPPAFPWLPQFMLGRVRQWYAWWRHDSCYDGSVFDAILRDVYGEQPLYRSHSRGLANTIKSGPKFGVVAASISDKTETVILGNFNTVKGTTDDCGYRILRPSNIQDEPLVWQAARATAAAPFIFSPIDLPVGTFQDGGLTDNFPGGLARRVSRAIWPACREPARLLSLGTGSPPESVRDSLPHFRHLILDGFLRRSFNAWMTSLDGEVKWREMKSQLDDSIAGYFRRLNVPLENASSALDDVAMIDHYRNLVLRYPGSARMAKDAALDLITARFFFELDTTPALSRAPFWCHGTIRCKGSARPLVVALQKLVPDTLEFVTDLHRLGPLVPDRDICPACNRFCWPVSLLCHDANQTLHIYIKAGRHGKWRINSFPSTPAKLVSRQQLDLPFGKVDHGRPARQSCSACDPGRIPFRGRRRRRHSTSSANIHFVLLNGPEAIVVNSMAPDTWLPLDGTLEKRYAATYRFTMETLGLFIGTTTNASEVADTEDSTEEEEMSDLDLPEPPRLGN